MGDRTWELARNFTCWLFVPLPAPRRAFGLSYPVFGVPHYQRRVSLNQGPSSNPSQRRWGGRAGPGGQAGPPGGWDLGTGLLLPTPQGSTCQRCHRSALGCRCKAWPSFEPPFPLTRSSCSVVLIWMPAQAVEAGIFPLRSCELCR